VRQKRSRAGRFLGAAASPAAAPVTVKALADHLGLSPATISLSIDPALTVQSVVGFDDIQSAAPPADREP
jgi:hypothetical protein